MGHHSGNDFEALRLAICHLRAERQAQQQHQWLVCSGSRHSTPLLDQRAPTESVQLVPGKIAAAASLDLIHSVLQLELGEEEKMREVRAESPGGGAEPGHQKNGTPENIAGSLGGTNLGSSNNDTSNPLSNQNAAAMTRSSQTEMTNDRKETGPQGEPVFPKAAEHGEASFSTAVRPVEGDRARLVKSDCFVLKSHILTRDTTIYVWSNRLLFIDKRL